MRSVLFLSLALVGSLALLPGVAGDTCLPTCEVPSHLTAGFVPATTIVRSGSTVTWTTLDSIHTASDTPDAAWNMCFNVAFGPTSPGSARFDIEDGVLYAQGEGDPRKACDARALPDGSFALEYLCLYHRATMNGVLVVTA